MNRAFVILAGGRGTRLGGKTKQFRLLGGREVWRHSLECARSLKKEGLVSDIVLVLPEEMVDGFCTDKGITVTCGGKTRSLSVLAALNVTSCDRVLLHDAARPFTDSSLVSRLIDAEEGNAAVIPVLPVSDALKRISGEKMECVDRDDLYITQTPQDFPRKLLLEKLTCSSKFSYKDEAELWLSLSLPVRHVEGSRKNFKITDEGDWRMACGLCAEKKRRTGLGYDVHPFVPGRKLFLGGVDIPSPLGLDGHSDADALCHAVCDALLSASGLPDIGTLYPASDETYRGISGLALLADVCTKIASRGVSPEWISAVVTAQVPRLAPWKEKMISTIEKITGPDTFSVTFKSGEHAAPAGDAGAVYVWVSATVSSSD